MAPIVGRHHPFRGGRDGAIAQLGERVVRNDEVGGSIPPGSTTLRPSGFAWRSRAEPEGRSVVPGEALLGEDGLSDNSSIIHPINIPSRFSGFAWRSRAEPEGRSVVPGVALLGEDGLLVSPHFPVNCGGRFSI